MIGGYQWLGEFLYGAGGMMDAATLTRVNAIFDKAEKGLSIKPLRVSIKMAQNFPPVESYASIIRITETSDDIQVMLKVDSHYGVDLNNLYLALSQNGTYAFESN